jgi:hypothetical protein
MTSAVIGPENYFLYQIVSLRRLLHNFWCWALGYLFCHVFNHDMQNRPQAS